jgi:hypothetical protein
LNTEVCLSATLTSRIKGVRNVGKRCVNVGNVNRLYVAPSKIANRAEPIEVVAEKTEFFSLWISAANERAMTRIRKHATKALVSLN